tara:strand:+ start:361 stop:627 length:267 start_codon:yes stop_codon:yes gene_type:complete
MPNVWIEVQVDSNVVLEHLDEDDIIEYLGESTQYWSDVLKMCPFDADRFLLAFEDYLEEWRDKDLEALKQLIAKVETKNKEMSDVAGL